MSACNEYVEFACRITLETGAPPHLLLPILRRLRRLATRHHRLCETACNGCRTCHGMGFIDSHGDPTECSTGRPCPSCSTNTVEAAIRAECAKLTELRERLAREDRERAWSEADPTTYRASTPAGAAAFVRRIYMGSPNADRPTLERLATRDGARFAAEFQHDPRGATVRVRVPNGASAVWGGIVVPTARR